MDTKEIGKIIKILKENPEKCIKYHYELIDIITAIHNTKMWRYMDGQKQTKGEAYLNTIRSEYGVDEIRDATLCDSNGEYFYHAYQEDLSKCLIRPIVNKEKLSREFLGDELFEEVKTAHEKRAKPDEFRALLEKILTKLDPI